MTPKFAVRQWGLAILSTVSLIAGAIALQSCGGEGGPIGGGAPGGGGGGGDTSITRAFKALQPAAQQSATYVGSAKCGTCHGGATTGGSIYEHWSGTAHATAGVGCEQCHGPGSAHVAAPSTTTILTFPNSTNPIVCGQCHGPIYDDWSKSKHAQVVPDPVVESGTNLSFATGSRCFVCHSGLVRIKVEEGLDPATLTLEQAKELADQTYDEANPSASAVPFTASCATCHNPHMKTGNLDVEGEEVQLRHSTFNTDTTLVAPGTTAAQFQSIDHTCAECHNGRGANGSDTKLQTTTSRPNMHDSPQFNMLMGIGGSEGSGPVIRNMAHATIPGQCAHCHMPGARHTFTVSYDTSCLPCHTAADAAARVTAVKGEITSSLYALQTRLDNWAQTTFGDSTLWDYTALIPTGHTAPDQTLVPIEVKRARHNYYFVIRDASFGPHNAPYAEFLIQVANDNLDALGVPPAPAVSTSGRTVNTMLQELQQHAAAAQKADTLVNG